MKRHNMAFFDFRMTCDCAECGQEIDLENYDSKTWIDIFKKWVNNDKSIEGICEDVDCTCCGHTNKITIIVR